MEPILDSFEENTYKDDRLALKIIFLGLFSIVNPILLCLYTNTTDWLEAILFIILYGTMGIAAQFLFYIIFIVTCSTISILLDILRLHSLAKPLRDVEASITFSAFAIICNIGIFFISAYLVLST